MPADPSSTGSVVAVDVGGTTLKGALVDRAGGFLHQERRDTRRAQGPDAVLEDVLGLVDDLVVEAGRGGGTEGAAAVGVTVPGPVDERRGVVRYAPNLGWRDLALRELLAGRTGLPAVVAHDVRAAATGEGALGGARDVGDYLFVAIGTGIGGAIVIDGQAYPGPGGIAGELGHMLVEPDGPPCGCGARGHLEALASAAAIARLYSAASGEEVAGAAAVVDRAVAGDPDAERVWRRAITALASGLADCVTLLNPSRVVIGGGLSGAGDRLLVPLTEGIAARLTVGEMPAVVPAELGPDAGARGVGLMAWELARGAPPPPGASS